MIPRAQISWRVFVSEKKKHNYFWRMWSNSNVNRIEIQICQFLHGPVVVVGVGGRHLQGLNSSDTGHQWFDVLALIMRHRNIYATYINGLSTRVCSDALIGHTGACLRNRCGCKVPPLHAFFFGSTQMLMKAVPLWSLCMTTSLAVLIESQSERVWLGPSVRLSLAWVWGLGWRGWRLCRHTERLLGPLQPCASIFPLFFWWDPNVALESLRLSVFVSISHHPLRGDASTAVSDSV